MMKIICDKDDTYSDYRASLIFENDFKNFVINHDNSVKTNGKQGFDVLLSSNDGKYNLFYRYYYNKKDKLNIESIELDENLNCNGRWYMISRSFSDDNDKIEYGTYSQNCTMDDFIKIIIDSYDYLWVESFNRKK